MNNIKLVSYGLHPRFVAEASLFSQYYLARVTRQDRSQYQLVTQDGEIGAQVSGRFSFDAEDGEDYPVVGDWVLVDRTSDQTGAGVIHKRLSRVSELRRKASGTSQQSQIVAANLDTVFLCMALNADYNLRRLERYLTAAWDSRATPVVVLTKADLCENLSEKLAEVQTVSLGVDVFSCSQKTGYDMLLPYFGKGKTVALIGSSGVGKSTMINQLMGSEILSTQGIREDDAKGRHTTSYRQMLLLPTGGAVIDTPGMRELGLESGDLGKTFEDLDALGATCRYSDCTHSVEPGCSILEAIDRGELDIQRLESWRKLAKELSYDGLNSRQIGEKKIDAMFGGKAALKQFVRETKKKNKGKF